MYKERFENVFRVAQKLTSSLNIGEVLEQIRDEARLTLPQLQEVRLLVADPTVQKIVDKDPATPDLQKKDADGTALFLDVAGYTRISETQSRDTLIIEEYFSGFLDVIHDHGGDINETAGDGLTVISASPSSSTLPGKVAHGTKLKYGSEVSLLSISISIFTSIPVDHCL